MPIGMNRRRRRRNGTSGEMSKMTGRGIGSSQREFSHERTEQDSNSALKKHCKTPKRKDSLQLLTTNGLKTTDYPEYSDIRSQFHLRVFQALANTVAQKLRAN